MRHPGLFAYTLLVVNMASFAILLDSFMLGAYRSDHMVPVVALMTLCATVLWLSLSLVSFLYGYVRVRLVPEAKQERKYYVAHSAPYFDPTLGVMMKFTPNHGGPSIEVQVNPSWISLLDRSLKINGDEHSNESAILGSFYSAVKPGDEPASLVAIKSGPHTIGFGCRTKIDGEDALLTANHVWNGAAKPDALAKNGKQVAVEDWAVPVSSDHQMLDFVAVRVPSCVWSKLGVKSTPLVCPSAKDAVTCYGGPSSDELLSSVGNCSPTEFAWKVTHNCPTAAGWSGTPLYSSRGVVGMHTGFENIGKMNRGVNMFYVANYLLRSQETLPPELSVIEIPFEDVETRSYEFLEVEIVGRGKAKLGKREFAWIPESGKYWADQDEDELPPPPKMQGGKLVWADAQETLPWLEEPLNCQRAAGLRPLPPSMRLQATTSQREKLPRLEECPSDLLVSRLASLESCVENLLQKMSLEPPQHSQSSPTTLGPIEAQKQSFAPSYCKQESLIPPGSQAILKELVKTSLSATPPPNPVQALDQKPGPSTQSSKKSARRRNRRKSTKRQAQGSPSPASLPPTKTS
ncbi:protease/VPg [Soybean yellow common mosaic virus]|uniref:Protease/VPg n=3 Tax=Soybean yellow common mosaic virus TaxID=1080798 RepID=G3F8C5_9VIRU|nr:polyprotein P2a [Soybean yellow common mosaic virus]AEO16606.1 protease/VPg [Soybean yellow common mosaic virus]